MDLFREAILNKTTMSSISYCKAVTSSGQTLVNGKGQEEGRRRKCKNMSKILTGQNAFSVDLHFYSKTEKIIPNLVLIKGKIKLIIHEFTYSVVP